MISLKAFLPILSRFLGLSPAALYERQRALVRLGILPAPTARGRNSGGAMATPDTVALVLLSVLVTDNLSDMDERIASFATKTAVDPVTGKPGLCQFTKRKTLLKAIAAVLADSRTPSTMGIEVARKARAARLFDLSDGTRTSEFGKWAPVAGVELKATFGDLFLLSRELEEVST